MLERENIDNFIADDLALRNRNWGQIEDELAEKADANRVYTKLEANTLLNEKADVNTVDDGLSNRYTKTETDVLLNEKATVTELADGLDARYTKDETDGLLDEKANRQQEEWITPTLLNGWSHHGAYTRLRYMKDTLGFVHISGHVVAGTSSTIFELPEGYRPIGSNEFLVNTRYNTVEPGLGHVNRVGTVRMTGGVGTGTMVSIHMIFRAER